MTVAAAVPVAAAAYLPVSASADTFHTVNGPAQSQAQKGGNSGSSLSCTSFKVSAPDGAVVESVSTAQVAAGPYLVPGPAPLGGYTVPDVPAHCEVTVGLTHPGGGDHAKVQVWLPDAGWNGRFLAVGGAAYQAGDLGAVATQVKAGYAVATTDAGVSNGLDVSWALKADGSLNQTLLENFSSRSVHEMSVVAKQVIATGYRHAASYSYFNGCSTGGRQGYMEAQQYPTDFDGINADAPGINWDQFEVATLWPQVVMNEAKTYPTACEFDAFNAAAIKSCDKLDGLVDGLISDPGKCDFDPRRLVGTTVVCDGKQVTITAADAAVVRKIWDGPRDTNGKRLWYGLPVGATFNYLAASQPDGNGGTVGSPFFVPSVWVSTFVKQDPAFNTANLTYAQYDRIFQQARAKFDAEIGTRDADLSAFRNAGGKLITWHGDSDQLIPTAGTIDYRQRVEARMGGSKKVDDFYRVFLAPGTAHCGLVGGSTVDDLSALTAWVEQGKAPAVLHATLTTADQKNVQRDLCRYPMVSHYTGGDPAKAGSFRCVSPSQWSKS
ncbi:tannase/feruloyl esterase family alpha/beta hydrolase [Catenulispora yoronensis]|uniref:Tannase/feruloyl esterase family alpha/beta hydrolase n=2 Tax=Catenulispora yoronensis TaxID=450799 RepID=A0ABN2XBU7_9ACTN